MSKLLTGRWIPLHSQPAGPELATRLVALDSAREALGPHGFLPGRAPAPPRLPGLAELGDELPGRYHGPDCDVRPWLAAAFAAGCAPHDLAALDPAALDDLMVVVANLAHAYRWAAMPAPAGGHGQRRVELPVGLARLWGELATRLDVPRCGNLYHMVLHNWRVGDLPAGGEYATERLLDGVAPRYPWLHGPEADELAAFAGAVVETEAHGVTAVDLAAPLFAAVSAGDARETAGLLERLAVVVAAIGRVFARAIRRQQVAPHTFLALIQPHFLWGVEHDGEVLEGASGAQTPTLQLLDAMLAVPRESPAARAALHSRAGLPPRHRRFLAAVDALGGELRALVERAGDPALTERYDACVRGLQHWRRVHQKRGALYLAGDPQRPVQTYMSVGRVVEGTGDRAARFDAAMEAHIQETAQALLRPTTT